MHPDYRAIQDQVTQALAQLDILLWRDDEFSARYLNSDAWAVILQGDPHMRPAFDILIVPPLMEPGRDGMSLRIIMRAVNEMRRQPNPPPSLDNQLRFLADNAAVVFATELPYRAAYDRIDADPSA